MVCSFLEEETGGIIDEFLKKNKNFKLEKFSTKKSINAKSFVNDAGFYHILPNQRQNKTLVDGFFAAILKNND